MSGKWNSGVIIVLAMSMIHLFSGLALLAEEVYIPDTSLRETIRLHLGLAENQPITDTDMLTFDRLSVEASNLTGLEYARNLTDLYVYTPASLDLSPITGLTSIELLAIDALCPLQNVATLGTLSGMYSLNIQGGLNNADLLHIGQLNNVWDLGLTYTPIDNISPLSGLTQLTHLNLSGTAVTDMTQLNPFQDLVSLRLSDLGLTSIADLPTFTDLRSLNLTDNSIENIGPLSRFQGLQYLSLGWNQLEDISPLSALEEMVVLFLVGNDIPDISALAGMNDLVAAFLDGNMISDLEPLSGKHLDVLELSANQIVNIEPLTRSQIDSSLYLEANPLGPEAYEQHIPMLLAANPGLIIDYDPAPEPGSVWLILCGLADLLTRPRRRASRP